MPTKQQSACTAKVPKVAKGAVSHTSTKPCPPNVLSDLEDLDKETLQSLTIDAPVRLTPPPGNDHFISEPSPAPLSKMQLSDEMMEATL